MENKRLAQLKEFLKAEPNDPFLKYAIATEFVSMGDFETARDHFEALKNEHPDYIGTYYHFAQTLLNLGDEAGAIEVLKEGIPIAQAAGNRKAVNEMREVLEDPEDDW